jgi:hypothetical protein
VELDKAIPRGEAFKIAESLGISAPTFSKIRKGQIAPTAAQAAKIAERFPECARGLWDVPYAMLQDAPAAVAGLATPELAMSSADLLAGELLQMQQAMLTMADVPARVTLALKIGEMVVMLGKLTGAGSALTARQIQQSAAWLQIQRVIVEALSPWPEALRAVEESLRALGREVTI